MSLNFSKLTLVAEFLVMAVVLIVRPYGLLGRPQGAVRNTAEPTRTRCARRSGRSSSLGVAVAVVLLTAAAAARAHVRPTRWCSASTC